MPSKRPTFEEFSAGQRRGTACWFCGIPERHEIEQAVLSGRGTKAAAARYLRDVCGYAEATTNRVDNHFANHVKPAA